jgi:hypothetical protein
MKLQVSDEKQISVISMAACTKTMVRGSCGTARRTSPTTLFTPPNILGRCQDFFDIAEVEQCRTQFMQTINRDRLNGNSRITLATFVEGAYLPWTKEEHRASTSKRHHEIWRNLSARTCDW